MASMQRGKIKSPTNEESRKFQDLEINLGKLLLVYSEATKTLKHWVL